MNSTTQFVSIAIILLTLATYLIITQSIRRRRALPPLRVIPAFDLLPLMAGESIEADRPLHMSFGSATIGGTSTPLALSAAELFYRVALRSTSGAVFPIVTGSEPMTLPLAQDTLRRAYAMRDRLDRYRVGGARWLPAGGDSLIFAGALTAAQGDDLISGNLLVGAHGAEIALVLDAAARRRMTSIAASSLLEGQAVAYVMADRTLIGEEIFAAGAYLDGRGGQLGVAATLDLLRWLLILIIILFTIDGLTGGSVFRLVGGAAGGR